MKIMMLLLSLVSLLASLATTNIERSCNCIDDICIDHQGFPPGNTSCFFNVPTSASDTDTSDSDGYAYQACGNTSYADLSSVSEYGVTANISNCIWIMEDLANSSFVFLASQLYNSSALAIASYGDCYLWVLGGANATAELTDADDTFFVGNMDLVFAMGNSIINYGNDNGVYSNFSVCGTIPSCNFYNTQSASSLTAPDFSWCLGSEYIIASWVENRGSFGHDMVTFDDLPSEQLRQSYAIRSQETVINPVDEELSIDELIGLVDRSKLESRSKEWYLRCDVGDRTLAQCTQLYDTYCDELGRLQSDDVTCRFDCSCFRVPRARCGLHYGFIYDCYDEDDKDKIDGASADGPELPPESANKSSTTEENRSQLKHE